MHDEFLKVLREIAAVKLVASYTDAGLQTESDSIQIFLPDMHLLSDQRRALYKYGTNYDKDLLVTFVRALLQFSKDGAAAGNRVDVFHIGDYLDLWRDSLTPGHDPDAPKRIRASHIDLVHLLEDHDLNTGFLFGNHDFDLYLYPEYNDWFRRFFIPGEDPRILVMHGDYFDWIERTIPEEIRDIAVYLFGQSHEASDVLIGKMRDLTYRCNHPDYTNFIQLDQPAVLGSLLGHDQEVPANYNLQELGTAPDAGVQFLQPACDECVSINQDEGSKLRMVIIGHTHHARIATMKMPGGTPFALVDIGAWIEYCKEDESAEPVPNAQVAALSENQVRIYQLGPK